MNNITVFSNGCPENRNDCARMENLFRLNGWTTDHDLRNSSLIAFNACGLTNTQEEKSIHIINSIKAQMDPNCRLVVWGCLYKINPGKLSAVYQGASFGSDEPERISELIGLKIRPDKICANHLVPPLSMPECKKSGCGVSLRRALDPIALLRRWTEPAYRRLGKTVNLYGPDSYIIKTSTGCMNSCSYCAVKISRGRIRSKTIWDVKKEFEQGLAKGYTDFALIATDVGSYGLDNGCNLADLLDELTRMPGEYQIRIRNIQPRHLLKILPEMETIVGRGKISFMGLTAQSGSDNVLKSMRRGYTVEQYRRAVSALKRACPELHVRTQLMVGFPGETDEDFQETLVLVDDVDLDYIETFKFQPRLETAAAKMGDQVPEPVSKHRHDRLRLKVIDRYAPDLDFKFAGLGRKMIQSMSGYYLNPIRRPHQSGNRS